MHKDYLKFIDAHYYLIFFAYFLKLFGIQKSKMICYQSLRVNTIHSIVLSRSCERSLGN
jgi:hypothetical protein